MISPEHLAAIQKERDTRVRQIRECVRRLTLAVAKNQWDSMQQEQDKLVYLYQELRSPPAHDPTARLRDDLREIMGPDGLEVHCHLCGLPKEEHVPNGNIETCIFSPTQFDPCNVSFSSKALQFLREGRLIDAIKEHRIVTGCGLKEAKDLVEAESRAHGWGKFGKG